MFVSQSVCTEHCAGYHRYASLAFVLKKLRSQDVERYFKKWFLKHFQLSRVGGLSLTMKGEVSRRETQTLGVSTEVCPLGEVRKLCCRKGAMFPDFKCFASRRPEVGGEAWQARRGQPMPLQLDRYIPGMAEYSW